MTPVASGDELGAPKDAGGALLPVVLLVGGLAGFAFFAWDAVLTWAIVFAGEDTLIYVPSRFGGSSGPPLARAVTVTLAAVLSALGAAVGAYGMIRLVRARRAARGRRGNAPAGPGAPV